MKLKNDMYTIQSVDKQSATYWIRLNPDCIIFKSHFPEIPVTPGVCILQIAAELLEEHIGEKLELTAVGNAKFLAVINPLETADVSYNLGKIQVDRETSTCKLSATVANEDKTFAKLSLTFSIR